MAIVDIQPKGGKLKHRKGGVEVLNCGCIFIYKNFQMDICICMYVYMHAQLKGEQLRLKNWGVEVLKNVCMNLLFMYMYLCM
jgi:hypothetical protein